MQQGFDEVIRVNLPIDMNKARVTNKRRQEKFKKLKSAEQEKTDKTTGKERHVVSSPAAPKPPARGTRRAADALGNLLFPQGL